MYQIINYWLKKIPNKDYSNLLDIKYAVFDGTFLHRPNSIAVLMKAKTHHVIKGRYGVSENCVPQLFQFFKPLKDKGLLLKSATVDGNPQVMRILKSIWPNITIQRCLVHVQRQGLMWCRAKPKRTDAKRLRKLFLKVTYIKTRKERSQFLKEFYQWEEKYGHLIQRQKESGKVFSDLKRARSMLTKALPNMFHYLNNKEIPPTTNCLEGYFSRLKSGYRNHRGLERAKRKNYFDWYFKFKPK